MRGREGGKRKVLSENNLAKNSVSSHVVGLWFFFPSTSFSKAKTTLDQGETFELFFFCLNSLSLSWLLRTLVSYKSDRAPLLLCCCYEEFISCLACQNCTIFPVRFYFYACRIYTSPSRKLFPG